MGLDDSARIIVEKNIDTMIENPKEIESLYRSILRKQGIEPNLERVLSYVLGTLYGIINGYYISKHKRIPDADEEKELSETLKRRAFELRQAFIGTRMEP